MTTMPLLFGGRQADVRLACIHSSVAKSGRSCTVARLKLPERECPDPSRSSPHRPTIACFDTFVVFVGGRNRCSLPTYSAVSGMPRPSAAKTITSAAEARKIALLCGHHLDRPARSGYGTVVRPNGGPIDRILEGLIVCSQLWLKLRKRGGCSES